MKRAGSRERGTGSREPGTGSRERGTGSAALVLAIVFVTSISAQSPSGSQVPAAGSRLPAPGSQVSDPVSRVAVEPIRCWRQATSGAVTIGEPFRVVLTCAVFESTDAQVVPDESRLNVASIQMAPFEIIGGTHAPDVRRGLRRFIQYEYDVRIISRDAIGQDVNIPPLTISYRIHSRVGAAAKLEGRDLSYLLPAIPVKVVSLVPADATDIRDASEASLASVDMLRSRSRMFEMVAAALALLAVAMAVFALVPLARRSGAPGKADRYRVPDRDVVSAAASSLRTIQAGAGADRWSDDDLAAALTAMRVIAAVAAQRSISRKPLPAGGVVPDGRLRVDRGLIRRDAITVSSALTPGDLAGHPPLDDLRAGIALLTAAMYQRTPERDAVAIDGAIRHAIDVAGRVASERSWVKTLWARR
jgi:hypothetical protein